MTADALWDRVVDIIDPPPWQPANRAALLPHQVPPDAPWDLWVLVAGRGAGKTEAAARYFAKWMREHPGHRGRIIGPTQGDVIESCVGGPSGLKSVDPEVRFLASAPGGAKVYWPNGSEALLLGTDKPSSAERFRAGGNRHIDWWEEMAACRYLTARDEDKSCWAQAELGLRLGHRPHAIASTTPRNRKFFRELLAEDGTVVTRARLTDNPHVNRAWRERMLRRYAGTRLGRQEIGGELLEDVDGALWRLAWIDGHRLTLHQVPDLVRVVVGVDPAVTASENSAETGIIVAGVDVWGHVYVLADESLRDTPHGWASAAIRAYRAWSADRIVGEVNNGGDMVESTLRQVDETVSYKSVRASRGKQTRAEPVSALYQSDPDDPMSTCWVHHVGDGFTDLEDQLTSWVPGEGESPDRLDALVWAITELKVLSTAGDGEMWVPSGAVPAVGPR